MRTARKMRAVASCVQPSPAAGGANPFSVSRRGSLLLTSVGLLSIGLTPAAGATAEHPRMIRVAGNVLSNLDPVPDLSLCTAQGGVYKPGVADYSFSGVSTFTGSFHGTGRFCGHSTQGVGPNGSIPFVLVNQFTGTVSGCGSGTAIKLVQGFLGGVSEATLRGVPKNEGWQLAAGSGTGGLTGIRGEGDHNTGQVNAGGNNNQWNGSVECVPRESPQKGAVSAGHR